jgi:hypothetical protein
LPVSASGALRIGAGDLDRVLDRFGAGRHEQRLLRTGARRQLVEPLAQLDVGLVARDLETGVGQLVELLADGLEHLRMPVSRIEDRDAAGEVDVTASVRVPQQRIFSAIDEYGMGQRDAAGYGGLASLEQQVVTRLVHASSGAPPGRRQRTGPGSGF